MSCTPPVRTVTVALGSSLFSNGGTAPGNNDVVLSGSQLMEVASLLQEVRTTLTVENKTVGFQGQAFYQLSDDGVAWGTPVLLGSLVDTNTAHTSSWTSIANPLRAIRFGVRCSQNAVNSLQAARISLVVDIRLLS